MNMKPGLSRYRRLLHRVSLSALSLMGLCLSTVVWAEGTTCDFDGNGYEDVAVGAISADSRGAVEIFYGDAGGFSGPVPTRFSERDLTGGTTSGPENGNMGFAVDCGDYDGDGYDDLAVSRPLFSEESPDAGVVWVMFGSGYGLGTRVNQVNAPGPSRYFGMSLASGDFNADGYDDLVVGSPMQDGIGFCDGVFALRVGMLHVYWGNESGPSLLHYMPINRDDTWLKLTVNCSDWPDPAFNAERYNAIEFGRDLVTGDFDADGTMDLAAVFYRPRLLTEKSEGGWVILYGMEGEVYPFGWGFDYDRVAHGVVEVPELVFHARIESGDFNGDGLDDLALGSGHGYKDDVSNVQIWYQHEDGTMQTGPSFEGSGGFGASLAAGDFNGEGCDDLAIGAPTAVPISESPTDEAYVYACTPGSDWYYMISSGQCGATFVYSCTVGVGLSALEVERLELGPHHANAYTEDWSELPPQYGARMGWSLSAGNFFAGDEDDLIVGAPGYWIPGIYTLPGYPVFNGGAILEYQGSSGGLGGGSWLPEFLWTSGTNGRFGWGLRSSFPCNAGRSNGTRCLSAGVWGAPY